MPSLPWKTMSDMFEYNRITDEMKALGDKPYLWKSISQMTKYYSQKEEVEAWTKANEARRAEEQRVPISLPLSASAGATSFFLKMFRNSARSVRIQPAVKPTEGGVVPRIISP